MSEAEVARAGGVLSDSAPVPADTTAIVQEAFRRVIREELPDMLRESRPDYEDPKLNEIHELHGRLLDKIKYLTGAEYDRYVSTLRLQQESLLASVEERLKGTDSAA